MKKRILIASDIHWCHMDWYGVPTKERVARFFRHVEEEYEKDPFSALLLLGDYSLDHWKWNIKGSWLANGVSYTKKMADAMLPRFAKLGIPIAMIAGNHEQYGETLWQELTGHTRTDHVVVDDLLFILPDTFGGDLDPAEHSDGTYVGVDVDFVEELMARYPTHKVILCAHHFAPQRESEAFRTLVRENDRILCLFGGHVHRSNIVPLGEAWGNKTLLYTGHYSYNDGKNGPVTHCMWGFRDLVVEENTLTSRYITPENDIVEKDTPIHHPYGTQDIFVLKTKV